MEKLSLSTHCVDSAQIVCGIDEGGCAGSGTVYITSREALLKSGCRLSGRVGVYEMDERTYFEIDEPSDWLIMENLKKGACDCCR